MFLQGTSVRCYVPTVCWVLTLIYDFVNIMIEKQKAKGYGAESALL